MIFPLGSSIRSLGSALVVLGGLGCTLVGVLMATDPAQSRQPEAAGAVGVAVLAGALGLGLVAAGLRTGVFLTERGVTVREVLGSTTYPVDEIAAVTVGEQQHHLLPLTLFFPGLRLASGALVGARSLAVLSVIPGARRKAGRAAALIALHTGRPLT
jgi:hypothetical protein